MLWDIGKIKSAKSQIGGKMEEKINNVNEVKIEINDSNPTHNNNHSITLRSKATDVNELLPMAQKWLEEYKQKKWCER